MEVALPNGSDLLGATHLYGYEDSGRTLEKMTSRWQELERNKQQLQAQGQELESQLQVVRAQLSGMDGAQKEVTYWRKNWLTPPVVEE